jgi:hypothetical protein
LHSTDLIRKVLHGDVKRWFHLPTPVIPVLSVAPSERHDVSFCTAMRSASSIPVLMPSFAYS